MVRQSIGLGVAAHAVEHWLVYDRQLLRGYIVDYIFGYGSLLSEYSRQHYSNIHTPVKAATVTGWVRAWCATYPDEGATYAGALRDASGRLDGVLIPSEIDQNLAQRERGYTFSRLEVDDLVLSGLDQTLSDKDLVWICETLISDVANIDNPLPQSYVDTCISGCMESQGVDGATRFIQQTKCWDVAWVNDRHLFSTPIYPRFTPVSAEQAKLIDSLLEQQGVLQFRQPVIS